MAMKREEFIDITKLMSSYWWDGWDEYKIDAYYFILKDLKQEGLRKTIQELAKTNTYLPKVNEIVEKYTELRNSQMERLKAQRAKELEKATAGQMKCEFCGNSGFVMIWIDGYEYSVRCTCPHGRDLNRFSSPQIDKRVKYVNQNGKEENIYIPTAKEALTEESYALWRAEKLASVIEKKGVDLETAIKDMTDNKRM